MKSSCVLEVPLTRLIELEQGDLSESEAVSLEEHSFACEACTARLQTLNSIKSGVRSLMQSGGISVSAPESLVRHVEEQGLQVRRYRVEPGSVVACTASPDDDFVAIELTMNLQRATSVSLVVEASNLETGENQLHTLENLALDPSQGHVTLLFSGDLVREYSRSQWTMAAQLETDAGPREQGPYTLRHTPWNQR